MRSSKVKRFVAALLSAVMICSLPTTAFAANTRGDSATKTPAAGVEAFTTTEDLIEQVKLRLVSEGKRAFVEQPDQAVVDALEVGSDYTYEEAENLLRNGIYFGRHGSEGTSPRRT